MSNISRKDFLKDAAICSAGFAAAGILGGCGTMMAQETTKAVEVAPEYSGGSNMKITAVTPYLCASRWLMIKIETDDGHFGWGECGAWAQQESTQECIKIIEKKLVGMDPFKIEWIWNMLSRTPHFRGANYMAAVSAVDVALWDLKGRYFDVPIYELLGGAVRTKIKAYETCAGKTPEELAENVKKLKDEGWKEIRIRPIHAVNEDKACTENIAEFIHTNIECLKQIREKAGWDIDISIETHRCCTPSQAIEFGKRADEYLVHFLEDPVCDYPEIQKYVFDQCKVPIATGERCINLYEEAVLINETNVRYVRPDMCVVGGITAGRKIAAIAEAKGVYIIPHNPLGPISTAAALQLDAVIPNFEVQEWPGTFGDFASMMKVPFSVSNGFIPLPEGPGLGCELIDDFAEKFPYTGTYGGYSINEDGSIVDR